MKLIQQMCKIIQRRKNKENYTTNLAKQLTHTSINLSSDEALSELTFPGVSSTLSKKGKIFSRGLDTPQGKNEH